MKYTRILGVAAALLAVSAVAATTAPAPSTPAAAPAANASREQPPSAATVTPAAEGTPAPTTALAEDKPATWGDAKAGQTKAGTCAACHGADGNSSDAQYPRLAGQHERYIAKQLNLFKTGVRENPIMMPMASSLSAQDMRDIGAYFATQHGQAGVADDSPIAAGDNAGKKYWQIGERLSRGRDPQTRVPACPAGHAPPARAPPGPAYPALGGQHGSYTLARMKFFREGSDKAKAAAPAMVTIAQRLTDEEIQGLATYVEGLHPAEVAKKAE